MQSAALPTSEANRTPGAEFRDLVSSVVELLNNAKQELDVDREAARQSISRASSLLWIEINKDAGRNIVDNRRALLGWQIRRITEYIETNIGGRIRVSDLSAVVRRSEAHFARAFKRTFGVGPHAYIIRYRVGKACQLMLNGDASLSDIALACGLSDQSHLCKLFRQTTGQTPAAWRRERQVESDRETCTSVAA